MDQNKRDREQRRPDERGIGNEDSMRGNVSDVDSDLQREGNLGNERNRNTPDRDNRRDEGGERSQR
jgi:hypothetical protein